MGSIETETSCESTLRSSLSRKGRYSARPVPSLVSHETVVHHSAFSTLSVYPACLNGETVAQLRAVVTCLFGIALAAFVAAGPAAQTPPALTADALFQQDKVWTVQLTMTAEAWTKMTPWLPVPGPPTRPVPAPGGAAAPPSARGPPASRGATTPPPPPPAPSPAAAAPPRQPGMPTELTTELLKCSLAPTSALKADVTAWPRSAVWSSSTSTRFRYRHAALRRRRGSSERQRQLPTRQWFPKPSFKIDLNKYVKGQNLAGLSTINLHNNITDRVG